MRAALTLLTVLLFQNQHARAEERLFPTAVLARGENDTQLAISESKFRRNLTFFRLPAVQTDDVIAETLQLRSGLGARWHVGATLPYHSRDVSQVTWMSPVGGLPIFRTSQTGFHNIDLWAKYGLIGDRDTAFAFSGALGAVPNTEARRGSAYWGELEAGWRISSLLHFYTVYSLHIPDKSTVGNAHRFSSGAFWTVSPLLTFVPEVFYTYFEGARNVSHFQDYGLSLSGHVEVLTNTYVLPEVGYTVIGPSDEFAGRIHVDASDYAWSARLSLYCLFGATHN